MHPRTTNPVLFLAHPGHELRVHHWVELHAPTVLVLTDGSGRTNRSRVASTERVLRAAGATPGPLFGRYPDREIYERLLQRDIDFFLHIAGEFQDLLAAARPDTCVCDAAEGYNPSHDICRYIAHAACQRHTRTLGTPIQLYRFLLIGAPDRLPPESSAMAISLHLDDAAIGRKLTAAENYPELAEVVASNRAKFGVVAFQTETLLPPGDDEERALIPKPFYEIHGEKQQAAGHYETVLRYRDHVQPLRLALTAWAAG